MKAARILILSSSHLSRNPRVRKEATTLGRAGYDVTVASVSSQPRFEALDRQLMRDLPFRRVTLNHTGDTASSRASALLQRSATWLARQLCSAVHLESPYTLGPAPALLRLARTLPADLTIVHTEIPLWAAPHLMRDGRRVAVDIEDWYSEDLLPEDRRSRPLRLLRRAESDALNQAAYSSATSQAMSDALAQAYHCPPPIVLRNSFPLQPRSRVDRPIGDGPPRLIWFSQTIGPGRGLEGFFAGWALTRTPSEVYLIGDERAGYLDELLAPLTGEQRARVQAIPRVTPEELPAKLGDFDVGLALEIPWPRNHDVTISNKILQYLNAGLALVSTGTAGQTEVMRTAPDAGLLIPDNEPTRLAASLDTMLSDSSRLRAMQLASRDAAVRHFCWEREEPRLLAAVDQALSRPTPSP